MTGAALKNLSGDEYCKLLYRLSCLPFSEAEPLAQELKALYWQCLNNLDAYEKLAVKIKAMWPLKKSDEVKIHGIEELIALLLEHSPVEFETEILAGEPLENIVS